MSVLRASVRHCNLVRTRRIMCDIWRYLSDYFVTIFISLGSLLDGKTAGATFMTNQPDISGLDRQMEIHFEVGLLGSLSFHFWSVKLGCKGLAKEWVRHVCALMHYESWSEQGRHSCASCHARRSRRYSIRGLAQCQWNWHAKIRSHWGSFTIFSPQSPIDRPQAEFKMRLIG